MTSQEHKCLSTFIKDCHETLRNRAKERGSQVAWNEHTKDVKLLKEYAEAMRDLSLIWENNSINPNNLAKSRIKWVVDYCTEYFYEGKICTEKRLKEQRMLEYCEISTNCDYIKIGDRLKILDVGSCFNPFKEVTRFDVTAIDLCPANDSVYECDFLETNIENECAGIVATSKQQITNLPKTYFDCVFFSLLLEYIPTSEQRIKCCQKAYDALKFEGLLIIITPDSQHVGKNAMIMKNWRYTLAMIGFNRIKFEKMPHITAMVFRKAINSHVTRHWAETHREPYMKFAIEIPQDKTYNKIDNN